MRYAAVMTSFVTTFDASFHRITAEDDLADQFFARFYERFTAADPRVREAFRDTDMAHQISMLRKSFFYMVNFFASTEPADYLQRIAALHGPGRLDIEPELFDLWLETLVEVLRDIDPEFDTCVELAWRVVLAPGLTFMKFRAANPDTATEAASGASR